MSSVCALLLDRLCASLTAHGWNERTVPSEMGSILAIDFIRADVVLTLTPYDGTDINGTACVLGFRLQTVADCQGFVMTMPPPALDAVVHQFTRKRLV
ncbi:hypothetical protein AO063_22230 [Pseudomonas fluorescens ICMP 11288]|uniref:Uncharacterized protein n=1 Tax=Pseudomonas fluorescens ICMP 11288 TaxID=1198309 RepID=A0A0W0I2Q5_PSEFL|nr:hypothetical protein AO063_22230 [Pseudomonas fluorescens ICMP 11288]